MRQATPRAPVPLSALISEEDDDSDFGDFVVGPPTFSSASEGGSPELRSSPTASVFSSRASPESSSALSSPPIVSTAAYQTKETEFDRNLTRLGTSSRQSSPPHVDLNPMGRGLTRVPSSLSPALPVGDDVNRADPNETFANGIEQTFAPFGSLSDNGISDFEHASLTPYEYAAAAKSSLDGKLSTVQNTTTNGGALVGFDTLDPVQCYAVGALAVVLLRKYTGDLNGLAFARSHVANILKALCLSEGQQAALFALSPSKEDLEDVVKQCVELVGDESTRFRAIQAMLALAVARGVYDARSRAFLCSAANAFGVPWGQVAAVELAVAIQLFSQADIDTSHDFEESVTPEVAAPKTPGEIMARRRRKKQKAKRVMKVGGITLVGGILFGVTGGIIAPALLSALAGVGVASAAGLAASGSVASGAVVGSLFGVAGAGVTQGKARKRTISRLEEFDFERPDDPRVIAEKEKRLAREAEKSKQQLLLKAAEEESEPELLVDVSYVSGKESPENKDDSLRRPSSVEHLHHHDASASIQDDLELEESQASTEKSKKKKQKRHPKVIVGSQGLEAAGHIPSLHICICVPAWLNERRYGSALRQFEEALKAELPCSQHIALRWESRRLYEMGLAFAKFWASKATVTTIQNAYPHAVAAASSVAGAIAFAFALPLTVLSCLDYIDNPWSVLVSLSNTAGEDLADVLVARSYGQRPVTLFGYSIGARVIFKCLESLASRNALGIVDNVFLMSAPISADPKRWAKVRPVVAGRIVNGYGIMDWALAFFHRGCGHGVYVSGLRAIEQEGIENLNMSYIGLEGHKELKDVIPRAMRAMGVGRGYISIPPAKVVTRHGQENTQPSGHVSKVNDEPDGLDNRNRLDIPSSPESPASSHVDALWGNSSLKMEALPTRKAMEKEESQEPKPKEKKKSSAWTKLSAWTSKKISSVTHDSKTAASNADKVEGQDSENIEPAMGDDLEIEVDNPTFTSTAHGSRDRNGLEPSVALNRNGRSSAERWDDINTVDRNSINTTAEPHLDSHTVGGADDGGFDWDLQRKIWEQQELQLQERGFADDALDIDLGTKVVLGIGIEVAGLRIQTFIEQDAELPVKPVTEYFTNCCMDQKALAIRVYEHERKRKSLPLNPFRQEKKYPKLLGETELIWTDKKSRAEGRFAITIEVTTEGEVIVDVCERYRDGTAGKSKVLRVPRHMLCTMRERVELDAARDKDKQLLITMGASAAPT